VLRRSWRWLVHPLTAWLAAAALLWLWHAPPLYESALRHEAIHAFEHATLLVSALLYWWSVLETGPARRLGYGLGLLSVFTMAVQSGVLGALITFAPRPWYASYDAGVGGLSALADQQLAGAIMWVPAGGIYLVVAALVFLAWLRAAEREVEREERDRDASPARSERSVTHAG
jgi:putative membrane protein